MAKSSRKSRKKKPSRTRQALVWLRLGTAGLWLWLGWLLLNDTHLGAKLGGLLYSLARQNPFFFYEDLLNAVLIPNVSALGQFLTGISLVLGASLLMGLWVPAAALVQAALAANVYLAAGHTHPAIIVGCLQAAVISWVLFWGRAGLVFGLDGVLFPVKKGKKRRKPARAKRKPRKKTTAKAAPQEDEEEADEALVMAGADEA